MTPAHLAIAAAGATLVAMPTLPAAPGGIAGAIFTVFASIGFGGWGLSVGLDRIIKFRLSNNVALRQEFAEFRQQVANDQLAAAAELMAAKRKIDDLHDAAEALILTTDKRIVERDVANDVRVKTLRDSYDAREARNRADFDDQIARMQESLDRASATIKHERSIGNAIVNELGSRDVPTSRAILAAQADAMHVEIHVDGGPKPTPETPAEAHPCPTTSTDSASSSATTTATPRPPSRS
jgi:hypothetical protein